AAVAGSGLLRGLFRLGREQFVSRRILEHQGERRVFLRSGEIGITLIARLAQIEYGAINVSRIGKRLGEQVVEAPALRADGTVLDDGADARAAGIERSGVELQRLAERGNRIVKIFLSEIGVTEIQIERSEITLDGNRLFVGANRLGILLPLVQDGADVVLGVGIARIHFRRFLIALQRQIKLRLVMVRNAQFVPVNGVV